MSSHRPSRISQSLLLWIWILVCPVGCTDPGTESCVAEACVCGEGEIAYPEFGCISDGYRDNNRDYDYYLTQMGTGEAEGANCGPTSAVMAMRWYDEGAEASVATLRDVITPGETGWWYTNNIEDALTAYNTPYRVLPASGAGIIEALERGSVLLICITMNLITRAPDPASTHFDRFYDYDSGHFLLVKGYIGGGEWLIVHDPNNWEGDYYDDALLQPLGRDRYYSADEVLGSMEVWWPYFFEIGIPGAKRDRTLPIGRSGP